MSNADTARAELRERVARAVYNRWQALHPSWPAFDELAGEAIVNELADADAAIAVVLEEAAGIAALFPAVTHGNLATDPHAAAAQTAQEIAAAILAMVPSR